MLGREEKERKQENRGALEGKGSIRGLSPANYLEMKLSPFHNSYLGSETLLS